MLAALLLNLGGNANVVFFAGATLYAEATPPEVRLELLDEQWYNPQGKATSPIRFTQFLDALAYPAGAEVIAAGSTFEVITQSNSAVVIFGAETKTDVHPVRLLVGTTPLAPAAEVLATGTPVEVIPGVSTNVEILFGAPVKDTSTRVNPSAGANVVMMLGASAQAISEIATVESFVNPSDEELIVMIRALRRRRAA